MILEMNWLHLNHSEYAAAVLKPYVSKKTHWIIEKHGEFQMYYYAHHLGKIKTKEINTKIMNITLMLLIFVKNGTKLHLILITKV